MVLIPCLPQWVLEIKVWAQEEKDVQGLPHTWDWDSRSREGGQSGETSYITVSQSPPPATSVHMSRRAERGSLMVTEEAPSKCQAPGASCDRRERADLPMNPALNKLFPLRTRSQASVMWAPRGSRATSGDIFSCHDWSGGWSWRDPGSSELRPEELLMPYNAQDSVLQQRMMWPPMSIVTRMGQGSGHWR